MNLSCFIIFYLTDIQQVTQVRWDGEEYRMLLVVKILSLPFRHNVAVFILHFKNFYQGILALLIQ